MINYNENIYVYVYSTINWRLHKLTDSQNFILVFLDHLDKRSDLDSARQLEEKAKRDKLSVRHERYLWPRVHVATIWRFYVSASVMRPKYTIHTPIFLTTNSIRFRTL